MSKITLTTVGSLQDTTTAQNTINANNTTIQTAFDNTLSRNGTLPNSMNASLDMNSNKILNLPTPTLGSDVVRMSDVGSLFGNLTGGAVLPSGGTTGQVLSKNSATNYDIAWQTPAGVTSNLTSPGGRLTLVSGQPVMQSDVTSQTVWYAPYTSKTLPVYNGSWSQYNFTFNSSDQVGLSLNLAGSANWAADTTHDVFAVLNGGVVQLGTRAWDSGMLPTTVQITNNTVITSGTTGSWTNAANAFNGTVTQSSATAAVINPSNNSYAQSLGQDWGVGVSNIISKVVVTAPTDFCITGGAGGTAVEGFYVFGSNDNANWHLLTVWRANDTVNGTSFTIPIPITEQQPYRYHRVAWDGNGTQRTTVAQVQFFKSVPPVSRRLTLQDGIVVNDATMTVRLNSTTTISVPVGQGTYLGSIHVDTATAGQVSANITYGASRTYGVWNYYNRKPIKLMAGTYYANGLVTAGASNFYTPVTTQLWNECESAVSGSSFHAQVLCGVSEEWVSADLTRSIYLNCASAAASYECGIAVDTTANFSGTEGSCNIDNVGPQIGFLPRAWLSVPPYAGVRTLYAIERQGNSGSGPQSSFTGPRSTCLTVTWMG